MRKKSRFEPFETRHIQKLREEFLKLTRNVSDLRDPKEALEFREVAREWSENLKDSLERIIKALENEKQLRGGPVPDEEVEKVTDEVRDVGWDLIGRISTFPKRDLQKYNYDKDRLDALESWEHANRKNGEDMEREIKKTWFNSVRRYARKFWKKLEEVKNRFQEYGAEIKTKMLVEDIETIEGFQAKVTGFGTKSDEETSHQEVMGGFKKGLRTYKKRAKKVAPFLLEGSNKLPLEIDFNCSGMAAGKYSENPDPTIVLCASVFSSYDDPDRIAHIMAHETGHHIWRSFLSEDQKQYWKNALASTREPLDIDAILDKWPENMLTTKFKNKLKKEDPKLYIQWHSTFYEDTAPDLYDREDLEEHRGEDIEVYTELPTEYSSKDSEEAFNEVLGSLVAYGPRTVPDAAVRWMKELFPQIKTSSRHRQMAKKIATKCGDTNIRKESKFEPFEERHIQKLREEFLKLTRQVPKLDDPAQAVKFHDVLRKWRIELEESMKRVKKAMKAEKRLRGGPIPDRSVDKAIDELNEIYGKLDNRIISFPKHKLQRYDYEKDERYPAKDWDHTQGRGTERKVKETWFRSVRRYARQLWDTLRDIKERFEERGSDLKTRFVQEDIESIAGFPAKIVGFEADPEFGTHKEDLQIVKKGLRQYRKRAEKVAPFLLDKQNELLFEIDFSCDLAAGGRYIPNDKIQICANVVSDPDRVVHVMAHEVGHHIWQTTLSEDQKEFWKSALASSREPLEIDEILDKWPPEMGIIDFRDKLKEEHPRLFIQMDSLSEEVGGLGAFMSREDFEEYSGDTIEVYTELPTGYASKSSEEAFNEVLGSLVAYGPRTVPDAAVKWMKQLFPQIKTSSMASRIASRYIRQIG